MILHNKFRSQTLDDVPQPPCGRVAGPRYFTYPRWWCARLLCGGSGNTIAHENASMAGTARACAVVVFGRVLVEKLPQLLDKLASGVFLGDLPRLLGARIVFRIVFRWWRLLSHAGSNSAMLPEFQSRNWRGVFLALGTNRRRGNRFRAPGDSSASNREKTPVGLAAFGAAWRSPRRGPFA